MKNIKLHYIIATQKRLKHQLWQQPIAHSCPAWPHEQPTVTKDSLRWSWSDRERKYFIRQRLHCLVQGIMCNF